MIQDWWDIKVQEWNHFIHYWYVYVSIFSIILIPCIILIILNSKKNRNKYKKE